LVPKLGSYEEDSEKQVPNLGSCENVEKRVPKLGCFEEESEKLVSNLGSYE
jgi:hypothetical protein